MALRARRAYRGVDYWPGFVDALSTMLLVIIFLLSVFMLAQFFLSREVSGKDSALGRLNRQIEELSSLLALERAGKAEAQAAVSGLGASLSAVEGDRARLRGLIDAGGAAAAKAGDADTRVAAEQDISSRALAQVESLNQRIAALVRQLSAIEAALGATEKREKDAQVKITDLGSRLNIALAQKVQELARYRSDFFGRLREILGDRPGVKVVGDRFAFQSEVLFDASQAVLNPAGRGELDALARAVIDLEKEIPPELSWVLRVDGHTDKRPIQSPLYPSNWELSSARAIAVVEYLAGRGVAPRHLVAAGFGEYQPIDPGDTEDAYRRNRRIELKLTER